MADMADMAEMPNYELQPIGVVRSELKRRADAPRQGSEGAPRAWLDMDEAFAEGLRDISAGQEIVLITWLHQARRTVLQVHPRGDRNVPLSGVFATRSPDRPNPLGLHRLKVLEISGTRLLVEPLEAIDGTPVVDIKPVLQESADS
jgi:tRNA-Thr(GGU) m(6)t(6)A37 methyltransferase TsaA